MSTSPATEDPGAIIERLLGEQGSVASRELAAAAGVTRQTAHAWLSARVEEGELVVVGRGRATRYRRPTFSYPLDGLEEHLVWRDLEERAPAISRLGEEALEILEYAVTEMVNNAIDHSGGTTVEVTARSVTAARSPGRMPGESAGESAGELQGDPGRSPGESAGELQGGPEGEAPGASAVEVEIVDDGVGIFDHLMIELGLADRFEALQHLSKGKVTTDPVRHTGEGIFFTSKVVDRFEISSGGILWTVDNLRDDVAVGSAPEHPGTKVTVVVGPEPGRSLDEVFDEYTDEYEFSRTRTVIKLFEIGTRFVSRAEGKRLVRGLERFRQVVLDFRGVERVGQGFVDEVFRVWANEHPETRLEPIHMNPAVEFMVGRGLPD